MMNLSKVFAAGAIATSLAFAQPETSDVSQPEKSAAKKSSLAESTVISSTDSYTGWQKTGTAVTIRKLLRDLVSTWVSAGESP